jgi:hypothetical protein
MSLPITSETLDALANQLRQEFQNGLQAAFETTNAQLQAQAVEQDGRAIAQAQAMADQSQQLKMIATLLTSRTTRPDEDRLTPGSTTPREATPAALELKPGASTDATVSRRPALPQPEMFGGDSKKYSIWKFTVNQKLRRDGHIIGTDTQDQAGYVIALLKDDAARFAQPWLNSTRFVTLDGLWEHMDARYKDPYQRDAAWTKLTALKQGQRPFIEFIQEFNQLLSESERDNIADEHKVELLLERISMELGQIMVSGLPRETRKDYTRTCHRLQELDADYQMMKKKGAYKFSLAGVNPQTRNSIATSTRSAPTVVNHSAPTVNGEPMDIDPPAPRVNRQQSSYQKDSRPKPQPITWKEREARRVAKVCFNCGRKECRADKCYWGRPWITDRPPRISNTAVDKIPSPILVSSTQDEQDQSGDEGKE